MASFDAPREGEHQGDVWRAKSPADARAGLTDLNDMGTPHVETTADHTREEPRSTPAPSSETTVITPESIETVRPEQQAAADKLNALRSELAGLLPEFTALPKSELNYQTDITNKLRNLHAAADQIGDKSLSFRVLDLIEDTGDRIARSRVRADEASDSLKQRVARSAEYLLADTTKIEPTQLDSNRALDHAEASLAEPASQTVQGARDAHNARSTFRGEAQGALSELVTGLEEMQRRLRIAQEPDALDRIMQQARDASASFETRAPLLEEMSDMQNTYLVERTTRIIREIKATLQPLLETPN